MSEYLKHEFSGGMCVNCQASERAVREFKTPCQMAGAARPQEVSAVAQVAPGGPQPVAVASAGSNVAVWALVGSAIGLVLGLLTRPALPLFGQLPVSAVLTRGANLSGLDLMLKASAEEAFNQVCAVTIGAALLGAVIGMVFTANRMGLKG